MKHSDGIDWLFCGTDQFWRCRVTHKDIPEDSNLARFDTVRDGYWIRSDSKIATILALKGCRFNGRWGQTQY